MVAPAAPKLILVGPWRVPKYIPYGSVRLIRGCPAFWKKTSGEPPAGPRGSQPGGILLFWVVSGPQRAKNAQLFGFSFGRSFRRKHAKTLIFTVKRVDGCVRHFGKKTRWTGANRRGWRLGCRDTPEKGPVGSPTGAIWTNSIPNWWFFFRPAFCGETRRY